MTIIRIQGNDRNGWDTTDVETMEEVHAYLSHAHIGNIYVLVNGVEYILPRGIGHRVEVA